MKRVTIALGLAGLLISAAAALAGDYSLTGGVRTYTGSQLKELRFPIGGIGTGSVSLGGRGDLKDWEIFNRPDKGGGLNFSFFAIWVKEKGKEPVARVLERKIMPPFIGGGHGVPQSSLSGLPRFDEGEFTGEYPFGTLTLRDKAVPLAVKLVAWNPFIPLDVDASSLPLAVFDWEFTNPTSDTVSVSLASSLANAIGVKTETVKGEKPGLGKNLNQYIDETELRGLLLSSGKCTPEDPNYGTMAMVTPWNDLDAQTRWYRGGWWDACHMFWDDFSSDGRLTNVRDGLPSEDGSADVGSLVLHALVPPGSTVRLPVVITWYFPNRENYWNGEAEVRGKVMKNYVAGKFDGAWEVAKYMVRNRQRLERETRAFQDALFSSTMPGYVLDAVSSQMSTLKTNVCMLLKEYPDTSRDRQTN